MDSQILAYYAAPGPLTAAGEYADMVCTLPAERSPLVAAVQALNVHIFWAERYGLKLEEARQAEVTLRPLAARLAQLLALDPAPLNTPRPLERRLVSNCRDFSLMTVGVLRAHGRPARARCGFGTYILPDHYEDHWVVETWAPEVGRWVWLDSQLDDMMRAALGIEWDTLDMPAGQFVTGGQAWLLCRRGEANPDNFGILEYHGWDFVRGNLIRDLLALNKLETLPWDMWGMLTSVSVSELDAAGLARLDTLAEMTLDPDANFGALRAAYEGSPDLQLPVEWVVGV